MKQEIKTNNLKFIGNSVVPLMVQKLIESNYNALVKCLNENNINSKTIK